MSMETTYQNDFRPYNLRYGFLNYSNVKQQLAKQHSNSQTQRKGDLLWRRHIANTNLDGQNSVEWIAMPNTQYVDPQFATKSEFESIKKSYEREMNGTPEYATQTPLNDHYNRVRFSPWQFIYPKESNLSSQAQGDFFQRTSPPNVPSSKFESDF